LKLVPGHHVFVTGLLPYEQCLSVLNIVLNRTNDSEIILKSKERLVFHVGFRRFASAPIYSQHTNGDKHKVHFHLFDNKKLSFYFNSLNDFFDHVKH
jgi:pre-rRNA-processing protein TSR1